MAVRGQGAGDPRLRVAFLAVPPVQILDVTGPFEVFSRAGYDVELVSIAGGPVASSCGLALGPSQRLQDVALPIDTVIVPGGEGAEAVASDPAAVEWLQRAAQSARRVGSVCTGAFCLGQAGLLDERRAVTHWAWCGELERRVPRARVEADRIFVRDGLVYTSAGITAGIDLALAMVEEDLGAHAALEVARDLVLYLRRQGGQSQFSTLLASQSASRYGFDRLTPWMLEHIGEPLTVERLAAEARMSPRHFARVFAAETKQSPARFVERLRIDVVRQELERGQRTLKEIAARCGFSNVDTLRRAFRRVLGVSLQDYAERFARATDRAS